MNEAGLTAALTNHEGTLAAGEDKTFELDLMPKQTGMLAIQMHYTDPNTNRWVDAGFWRWRVIAVKELPDGK